MKKTVLPVVFMLALAASSCADKSAQTPVATPATGEATAALNIRYIDADSIAAHYNLALDLQETQLRAISKLDNAQQSRAAEIQRFGSQIEEKMRNNGYLSEASYNADVAKFQKMQQDAQAYLANLERTTQQEMAQQQQQLSDSIESFIKDYNASKGFDAILYKAAGVYFNPALDITGEVLAGLNARYNRVSDNK